MHSTTHLAKAGAAVRDAKRNLFEAERRFDAERSHTNSSVLIAEIRAAERRLVEATAALRAVARS